MNASQQVQVTTFSSKSNEYYTPPRYIKLVRDVLGDIDLDPASCELANRKVRASYFLTKEKDGLSWEWGGSEIPLRIFLNPPYGKIGNKSSQGVWAEKLISEYRAGRVSEAIMLVRSALGYKWFEDLFEKWPVCFARERIAFIGPDGKTKGLAKQGAAFFYFGESCQIFESVFCEIGRVIMPDGHYPLDSVHPDIGGK